MATGKTIALTRQTFVGNVMSLLFNMLSSLGRTNWAFDFLVPDQTLLGSELSSNVGVLPKDAGTGWGW